MARVGKKEAARILRQIAKDYGPDTKYSKLDARYWKCHPAGAGSCRYVNTKGTPKCLIGVALVEHLGVDPKLLTGNGGGNGTFRALTNGVYDPESAAWISALLTPSAISIFCEAQALQDDDQTWGYAVQQATAHAR